MSSAFRSRSCAWVATAVFAGLVLAPPAALPADAPAAPGQQRQIRVCFDENNLPYSNARGEGFENKLAALIGRELNARIQPVWWGPRRAFVRHTLQENRCDAVMQLPSGMNSALTTRPYYRSSYVYLYRQDRRLAFHSLHDPIFRRLRIGAQLVGDDFAPPVRILSKYGVRGNLRGYLIYAAYDNPRPQAQIVDAVARGDVDVGLVWGPVAGYFAKQEKAPLAIVPIPSDPGSPEAPMAYSISVGVSKRLPELKRQIDVVLEKDRAEIRRLLTSYGVPLIPDSKD
jgi:mxaJ protein